MTFAALASAVLFVGGCAREVPVVSSCADSLAGVWRAPDGDWELLDHGATLEAFPLFDDAGDDAEVKPSPRVIALARTAAAITGEQRRRYAPGCVARTPVRITACTTHQLDLVRADPAPPLTVTPCTFSTRTHPSHRERWSRRF